MRPRAHSLFYWKLGQQEVSRGEGHPLLGPVQSEVKCVKVGLRDNSADGFCVNLTKTEQRSRPTEEEY